MRLRIEAATLDIGPGIRLSIRADGVIEISREQAEAAPLPDTPKAQAKAPKAKGRPVVWKPEVPLTPAPMQRPVLRHVSAEVEGTENKILEVLLHTDDPYQWRGFAEIYQAAFPTIPSRRHGRASAQYAAANWAIKRLRMSGELDCRKEGPPGARGQRSHAKYRLHKPDDVATEDEARSSPHNGVAMHAG